MGEILDFPKEHVESELICIGCKYRFIDVRPEDVWLKDLECPHCGKTGLLIMTGQPIDERS